jgi:hypothetical protein
MLQTASFLMVSLSRFDVSADSLSTLLATSYMVAAREGVENTPQIVMVEALQTGLYQGDMSTLTIIAVLKVSGVSEPPDLCSLAVHQQHEAS